MKLIHTSKAPKVVGPYSQAVQAAKFIYLSGQIGIDPQTGVMANGLIEQTKQVLINLKAVLKEVDLDETSVVKTTIYLTSMGNYAKANEIYSTVFAVHKPARAAVEVSKLPLGALIEIEAIAFKPGPCACQS